jgi:PAS domain S-box-containing protein
MPIEKIKSFANQQTFKIKSNLSLRLFLYAFLCSFALIIIICSIQLSMEYRKETQKIESTLHKIDTTFAKPLAESLWLHDKQQLDSQRENIVNLPYIQYVKIHEIVGNNEVVITHQGKIDKTYGVSKTFDLIHEGNKVGTLFVATSIDQIKTHLLHTAISILITQTIKIVAVTLCILLIVYYMVIRHINKIVQYTRNIQINSDNKPLLLDGRNQDTSTFDNELDEIAYLLNQMQKRIVKELTDKKIAIDELQQERDFSDTVINASSTIICCLDSDFKIASTNPAAVILTGYSQEELYQKNWVDIFVLEQHKAELQEKLSTNEPLDSIEIKMNDQMGELNTLLWTFSPFYEGMDIKYLIGFGHDITPQKKIEQEILLLNDQLEEKVNTRTAALTASNKQMTETVEKLKRTQQTLVESEKMASLGSLVAGVAHEINTPIGVSVTATSFLQEEMETLQERLNNNQLSRTYLERLITNVTESVRLLNSNLTRAADLISSFKQVAVDQSSEACYSFKIKENVEQVVTSLKHKIKQSRSTVSITCPENLSIYSFPGSFVQIYSNLIINSIIHGFHEWDGERNIFINIELQDKTLIIDYRDTGKGIPDDMTERIFDPFVTSKRGSGGSGLGTHIIYNIINQLFKGDIEYVIDDEIGAHFIMKIPYRANMNS